MPKRSNEFQSLIALIESLLAQDGVRVTESKEIVSIHGVSTEIDVAIECEVAGHNVVIGIECRDRSRKDDVTWIDGIIGKYNDLPVHKVIAVSSKGFSQAAIRTANNNNIETLTIEEANDLRWRELAKDPAQPILAHVAPVVSFVTVAVPGGSQRPDNIFSERLYRADGTPIGQVAHLCQQTLQSCASALESDLKAALLGATPAMRFAMVAEAQDSYWVGKDGINHPIAGLQITIEVRATHTPLTVESFSYRGIDVVHGKGSMFERPVRVLLLDDRGKQTRTCAILLGRGSQTDR
jgi:hypothetical protein